MKALNLIASGALGALFLASISTGSETTAIGSDRAGDEVTKNQAVAIERTYRAQIGQLAPDFSLTDLTGNEYKLSALRGKTVVLEWFNPECPVVVRAHSKNGPLKEMGNRVVKASDDVVWLAVNSGAPGNQGHGKDKNVRAAEDWGMEYPVLLDESGYVGRMFGAKTTPHMFVVDPKGKLVYGGAVDNARDKGAQPINYVSETLRDMKGGRVRTPSTKSYGCSVKYSKKPDLGLAVADFELSDVDGKPVRLSDYRGKILVLEWFNPECPVVKRAHGDGGSLQDAAKRWTQKDVAWLAINSGAPGKQGHGKDKNVRAIEGWSLPHSVLMDAEGHVGKAFEARTTPHMFILDQRGVLVYKGGHDDKAGTSYVDKALSELLSGEPVSTPSTKPYGCSVKY